jgi:hypothetical protein
MPLMLTSSHSSDASEFFKSLGLPNVQIHHAKNHFDFTKPSRRILVIGPMGSGKTEYSAQIWRDARVALNKSERFARHTVSDGADRRSVFFIRSILDAQRFTEYPDDALAYREDSNAWGTISPESPILSAWSRSSKPIPRREPGSSTRPASTMSASPTSPVRPARSGAWYSSIRP